MAQPTTAEAKGEFTGKTWTDSWTEKKEAPGSRGLPLSGFRARLRAQELLRKLREYVVSVR